MICPKCGKSSESSSKFCVFCGTPMPAPGAGAAGAPQRPQGYPQGYPQGNMQGYPQGNMQGYAQRIAPMPAPKKGMGALGLVLMFFGIFFGVLAVGLVILLGGRNRGTTIAKGPSPTPIIITETPTPVPIDEATPTPKPTARPTHTPAPTPEPFTVGPVGSSIFFGEYEQDNNTGNGPEPIEWIVMEVRGDRALLLSADILDHIQYNSVEKSVTWETCGLRTWLNDTFYYEAFSLEDRSRVINSRITTPNNPSSGTKGGNDTYDYVFVFSLQEAQSYFGSNSARQAYPTVYAESRGVKMWSEDGNHGIWLLRTPGNKQNYICVVLSDGDATDFGGSVNYAENGVRPAIWVYIDS